MSTKSLKKQLMAAIAMVLVAAVALGSSTYAWFANNTTVTANTMNITAQCDTAMLQIMASGGSGEFQTTATLAQNVADTKLNLVHPTTITQGEMEWGVAHSTNPAEAQISNSTTPVTLAGTPSASKSTVLAANSKNYVLQQDLVVRVAPNSADGKNLKVTKVTFDVGANSIAASGRLLVVSSDGYQLFKVVNGEVIATETGSAAQLLATMTAGTEYTLNCYFYFDGTDSSAYTDNATDLTGITAAITLGIDDLA